jgi:hypothetical protein
MNLKQKIINYLNKNKVYQINYFIKNISNLNLNLIFVININLFILRISKN